MNRWDNSCWAYDEKTGSVENQKLHSRAARHIWWMDGRMRTEECMRVQTHYGVSSLALGLSCVWCCFETLAAAEFSSTRCWEIKLVWRTFNCSVSLRCLKSSWWPLYNWPWWPWLYIGGTKQHNWSPSKLEWAQNERKNWQFWILLAWFWGQISKKI